MVTFLGIKEPMKSTAPYMSNIELSSHLSSYHQKEKQANKQKDEGKII